MRFAPPSPRAACPGWAKLARAVAHTGSLMWPLACDLPAACPCLIHCRVYQSLQRFTVLDLSNFYLDVAKDRLYINAPSAADRRACQTVLAALLEGMLPLIAPLLPHMAEDAWQNLPYAREQQSGEGGRPGAARWTGRWNGTAEQNWPGAPAPGLATCRRLVRGVPAPRTAVFQAGWAGVPDEWRQLPEADAAAWRAVLGIRFKDGAQI